MTQLMYMYSIYLHACTTCIHVHCIYTYTFAQKHTAASLTHMYTHFHVQVVATDQDTISVVWSAMATVEDSLLPV